MQYVGDKYKIDLTTGGPLKIWTDFTFEMFLKTFHNFEALLIIL